MKITIGVFFGGRSVEHEVSVISALQAIEHIDKNKYEVLPIYITKKGLWYTGEALLTTANYKDIKQLTNQCDELLVSPSSGSFDVVQVKTGFLKKNIVHSVDIAFPILHGTYGEDGSLQGLLEMTGIPYIGCNVLASGSGMDKIVTKMVLNDANLPVLDFEWFYKSDWLKDNEAIKKRIETKLGYPVIVKPADTGSSVGISKVKDVEELQDAIDNAVQYSQRIIVETMVTDLLEINCAVLGSHDEAETSPCEEPLRSGDILSFKDKYVSSNTKGMSGAKRILPAQIPDELTAEIKQLALDTFKAIDCAGVVRIDFLVDKASNKVYVNELNTIPGSLSFYLWQEKGMSYSQLIEKMVQIAFKVNREKNKITYTYDEVNLFANGLGSGAKLGKAGAKA